MEKRKSAGSRAPAKNAERGSAPRLSANAGRAADAGKRTAAPAPDAREAALEALLALRHGEWADEALDRAIRSRGLAPRDAALCTQLTYGVLQTRGYLDFVIASASSLKPNKIAPKVTEILRIAVYQILYLDKIPVSAAVNEAVSQTRRLANPRAASFVNAVLRRIASSPAPEVPGDDGVRSLSVRFSHPEPLVRLLLDTFGAERTRSLLEADNAPAPTVLRLNTLRGDAETLCGILREQGMELAPVEGLPCAVTVEKSGNPTDFPGFSQGLFTVQDTASQLDVLALDPQPGEEVLDMCAAPGGKSCAAAACMQNRGRIISCDLYETKLPLIDDGARRLGVSIIETVPIDATVRVSRFENRFDRVLADVPCSGLGVIRKKPDIRYKDLSESEALPELQGRILENAGRYVRPGGVLVYSTCTILPRENEEVVRRFLSAHAEFSPEPFTLPAAGACDGMRTLYPDTDGTDGFFIARLRRSAENAEGGDARG